MSTAVLTDIRSIFQYTLLHSISKVAKIQLTRSYRTYIRSVFQHTVPQYKSKVAKIR